MAASIDQQFIEYIVKSVVGNPDAVSIKRTIDEKGVLLELTVDPEDLGRVIGKRGATAQSLRTLLRALGTKNDARYNLKIVDVGGPLPSAGGSDDSQKPAKPDEPKDEPTDEPAEPPAEEAEAPAEDDDSDDEIADDTAKEDEPSDVVSRTRAELAEFDDLDL